MKTLTASEIATDIAGIDLDCAADRAKFVANVLAGNTDALTCDWSTPCLREYGFNADDVDRTDEELDAVRVAYPAALRALCAAE